MSLTLKVKLKPWPWSVRWELLKHLKGIVPLTEDDMPEKRWKRSLHPQNLKEWEKYDMMKWYRERINDVEEIQIASEVVSNVKTIEEQKVIKQREKLKAAKPVLKKP